MQHVSSIEDSRRFVILLASVVLGVASGEAQGSSSGGSDLDNFDQVFLWRNMHKHLCTAASKTN